MYVTGIGIFSLVISILALIITISATSYFFVQLKQLKEERAEGIVDNDKDAKDIVEEEEVKDTIPSEKGHHEERPPHKRGSAPGTMAEARIEWMDQITLYTEELITHSAALLQASKKIIQSNLEIQKNVATTATHKSITESVAKYNTNADEFKIVLTKLRLTFYDERKNAEALKVLKKIERTINNEYETQIHSDISRHEHLVAEYEKQINEFVTITRKQLEEEWEKIKRGR